MKFNTCWVVYIFQFGRKVLQLGRSRMVIPTSSGPHKALEVPPHLFQKHQFNQISHLAGLLNLGIREVCKQEHKVSYRCSLPSPLQKRSKDYKGLGGSASFELLSFLRLWQEISQKAEKLLAKVEQTQKLKICKTSQSFLILGSLLQWRWQ